MVRKLPFLLLVLPVLVACRTSSTPVASPAVSCAAPHPRLREGELAPDFVAAADDGSVVALSRLRSRTVMLHFYAAEGHPELDDARWANATDRGVVVVGVTRSRELRSREGAGFVLVSDPEGAVARSYSTDESANRTFVIGPDGTIEKVLCTGS